MYFTPPLARLIEEFQKFPGVGPKSAQRMAFFVLNMNTEDVGKFAEIVVDAKNKSNTAANVFTYRLMTLVRFVQMKNEIAALYVSLPIAGMLSP
jgi:recombinational DNA repair protein RecR